MRGSRAPALGRPPNRRFDHCVFARMPGVFEPCTRLDHLGWLRYCLSNPRFLIASDRSQVARRRVRLDLGDLGIIEQQLNQCAEPAWFPSLCPVVMHSPVTGLFRVLLDRFLLPTIRPRFQEQRTTGHTQSAPFNITMYGVTDSC